MDFEEGRRLPDDTSELELYNFSQVPIANILRGVALSDTVELGFVSKEMMNFVRKSGRKIDNFTIFFGDDRPRVSFESRNENFTWNLYTPEEKDMDESTKETMRRMMAQQPLDRKIGYHTLKCYRNGRNIYTSHHDLEHVLPKIFIHFVKMFDCTEAFIAHLHVDMNTVIDLRSILEHFVYYRIRRLSLVQSNRDTGDVSNMTHMDWCFQNLRVTQIHLGVEFARNVRNELEVQRIRDKVLAFDHVCFDECTWLRPEELLGFKSKTMMIGRPNTLQIEHLHQFIRGWMEGDEHSQLMWLNIKMNENWRHKEILRDLNTEPFAVADKHTCDCPFRILNNKLRPFYFLPSSVQVKRKDGTRAIICVSASQFFFHVADNGPPQLDPKVPDVSEYELLDLHSQLRRMASLQSAHGMPLPLSVAVMRNARRLRADDLPELRRNLAILDVREEARLHRDIEVPRIRAEIASLTRRIERLAERQTEKRRELIEIAQEALQVQGDERRRAFADARFKMLYGGQEVRFLMSRQKSHFEKRKELEDVLRHIGASLDSDDVVVEAGEDVAEETVDERRRRREKMRDAIQLSDSVHLITIHRFNGDPESAKRWARACRDEIVRMRSDLSTLETIPDLEVYQKRRVRHIDIEEEIRARVHGPPVHEIIAREQWLELFAEHEARGVVNLDAE